MIPLLTLRRDHIMISTKKMHLIKDKVSMETFSKILILKYLKKISKFFVFFFNQMDLIFLETFKLALTILIIIFLDFLNKEDSNKEISNKM
jgi:hypothetical protein